MISILRGIDMWLGETTYFVSETCKREKNGSPGSQFFLFGVTTFFIIGLVYRWTYRKLQKLSPSVLLAENLLIVSSPLKSVWVRFTNWGVYHAEVKNIFFLQRRRYPSFLWSTLTRTACHWLYQDSQSSGCL